MDDDIIFWERLVEMPDVEALDELRRRRTKSVARQQHLLGFIRGRTGKDRDEAARELDMINVLMVKIKEEVRIRNDRMDNYNWRNAVRTLLGPEAYDLCKEWIMVNGR